MTNENSNVASSQHNDQALSAETQARQTERSGSISIADRQQAPHRLPPGMQNAVKAAAARGFYGWGSQVGIPMQYGILTSASDDVYPALLLL